MESKKFAKKDFSSESVRLLALAPSQYGKSYMISEWVAQQVAAGDRGWTYERIIVFSPTARSDPSQHKLAALAKKKKANWSEANVFEFIDEAVIEAVYENNKKIKESGHHPFPYLLIFDDVLCDDALGNKRSFMTKIATSGRHFSISSILSCQIFKGFVQPVVRQQLSMIWVGRINSVESLELLLAEYASGAGVNKKDALETMRSYWAEAIKKNNGRGFLVINPYQ